MPSFARRLGIPLAVLASLASTVRAAEPAEPQAVVFAGGNDEPLHGVLYRPEGQGPFPAVVAMHGCSGLFDRHGISPRHADWGRRLAAQGFLVLFPDSFGSRGLGSQCGAASREIRPGRERVTDAMAAKDYLQGRSDVRADAVSLLGWSNGGSSVLYASAVAPKQSQPGFARAVAFYPGCRVPAERGMRPRMPLLILIGAADDWTDPEPCRNLTQTGRATGAPIDMVVYPNAYHDFDHPNLPVRVRRGLAYTRDEGGEAHIGTDPAARADALVRVPAFLAR